VKEEWRGVDKKVGDGGREGYNVRDGRER